MPNAQFTILVFLVTLSLLLWRPRGLGIGWIAWGGALFALITGAVTLADCWLVWEGLGNATLTLICTIAIAFVLDEAGLFRALALQVGRWGLGRGRWLCFGAILLAVVLTPLLTNVGTALFWTAAVAELLLLLNFPPTSSLVVLLSIGFIADGTSLPLQTSNPVNLVIAEAFGMAWWRYALVMVPVNLAAIATSLAILWFCFDRHLPPTYKLPPLPPRDRVISDPQLCRWSLPFFGFLLLSYFLAAPLGIPVSGIAVMGALVMFALSMRRGRNYRAAVLLLRRMRPAIPWQAIAFVWGMSLVVLGLRHAGLATLLSQVLTQLSQWGLTLAATGTGFLAMLLSGVLNQFPTALLNTLALQEVTGSEPAIREAMAYASIIGCAIGGKITPLGSLSTLVWLNSLARKGIYASWGQYIRLALVLGIPLLFVGTLSLAIWLPWLIA
jgi:arsenical pump membrane protein